VLVVPATAATTGAESLRATLEPGESRTMVTRATFGATQVVGAEVRINGKPVAFAGGSSVVARADRVTVTLTSSRRRGPVRARMVNAGSRWAIVLVRVEW
jgi:uncharacterized Zn-binding protein involved in type VI secretion